MDTNVLNVEDNSTPAQKRRKKDRKKDPLNFNNTVLPPCRVCGDKASGFHYGTNTCEACKGFFRRSLRRKTDYTCMKNENCRVYRMQKNNKCPKCRLDMCLSVGMSKEGIRNGRYTLETRTKYIKEVKALEDTADSSTENDEPDVERREQDSAVSSNIIQPNLNDTLEASINHIVETYNENPLITEEFLAGRKQREAKYLEEKAMEKEIFGGELKPVSSEEYKDIHKTTGLDVDGREALVNKMNNLADDFVKKLINFASGVPGFDELSMKDKTSLLKNGTFFGWDMMLTYNTTFNLEHRIVHSLCGTVYDRKMCAMFHDAFAFDQSFRLIEKMMKWNLSQQENIMIAALCMFQCDQFKLDEAKKVEDCLNVIVECLQYMLKRNHPEEPFLFAKIVSLITEYRTVEGSTMDAKTFEETFGLQISQMWHEMYDEKD